MQGRGPRQPEPFGGEPYVSTVPIKPLRLPRTLAGGQGERPHRRPTGTGARPGDVDARAAENTISTSS